MERTMPTGRLDLIELVCHEPVGLVQRGFANADLADVVQQAGEVNAVAFVMYQLQPAGKRARHPAPHARSRKL